MRLEVRSDLPARMTSDGPSWARPRTCMWPPERLNRSTGPYPCTSPVSALTHNVKGCLVRSWRHRDRCRRSPILRPVIGSRLAPSGIGVSVPMHSPASGVRSPCAGGLLFRLFAPGLVTDGSRCCRSRASSVVLSRAPVRHVKSGRTKLWGFLPLPPGLAGWCGEGLRVLLLGFPSQALPVKFFQDLFRKPLTCIEKGCLTWQAQFGAMFKLSANREVHARCVTVMDE